MLNKKLSQALAEYDDFAGDEMLINSKTTPAVLATPTLALAGYFIAGWQAGTAVTQVMNAGNRMAHDKPYALEGTVLLGEKQQ